MVLGKKDQMQCFYYIILLILLKNEQNKMKRTIPDTYIGAF